VLPRLHERDIDVLLQEELIFNEHLRQLFAQSLGMKTGLQVQRCRLSVIDSTGETDLFAEFASGPHKCALLIENKIDAEFQPRQPERYKERARGLVDHVEFESVLCVLIAPRRYIAASPEGISHFDAIVSYEDISAAIAQEATPRSQHRAALLLRAVEQAHSAYLLAPDFQVTDLWTRIYRIASVEFPSLGMAPPSDKGSQSKWIIFKADLPPRVTIDWKITKATVDLSFWKGASRRPAQSTNIESLRAGAALAKLGETDAITIPTTRPPAEWTEMEDRHIRDGLEAALQLLRFYKENPKFFV